LNTRAPTSELGLPLISAKLMIKALQELTDPYSIFDYAVSSPFNKKCADTALTLREPSEDRGSRQVVAKSAEPTWVGGSPLYYEEWLLTCNNHEQLQQ
jgi:hypothetical protein